MMKDEVYIEAIKHKFSINKHPCALFDCEFGLIYANGSFCDMIGLSSDSGESALKDGASLFFSDLLTLYKEQFRNVMLHLEAPSHLDIIEAKGDVLVFYKRSAPIITPSGNVAGVEVHFFSIAALNCAVSVLTRFAWYSRDEVEEPEMLRNRNVANLTMLQQTYLFFIMHGFSNSEISEAMSSSVRTVEHTVRTIIKKVAALELQSVVNRSDLKRCALSLGYGHVLPKSIMKPNSIPLKHTIDNWDYSNEEAT